MKVSLALVADYANISREGKLNILGIFDRIGAQSVPAVHSQMQLIMRLEADRAESEREHKVEIQLIDADGHKLFAIAGNIKFGAPPPGEHIKVNHIMQLNNLQFDHYGVHEFKILINNEVRISVPLAVVKVKMDE